jgi:MFS family permease
MLLRNTQRDAKESIMSAPGIPVGDAAASSRQVLSQQASFWVAAAIVAHTIWTSAAPAMTYPLYAAEWHLSLSVTGAIFAVYPIVVVAVLIGFGDLSDYIGRRTTMLLGLAASLIGVFLFAVAPDVGWVFAGRAFMGLGVGLSAGPAAAAMLEFSPAGQAKRASSINTVAQAFGLAAATIIGGGLIQYAPFPTRLNFWALFLVLAALFAVAWRLPAHTRNEAKGPWRPRLPMIPKGLGKVFLTAVTAVTSAYAMGPLMLSLGSQMAHELVGSTNVLVSGAAIALFAVFLGVVGLSAKGLAARHAMRIGAVAAVIGMSLLILSAKLHSLPVFLVAVAATGTGYSLMFMGGLNLISAHAPVHHRAGVISAIYLVAYVAQGVIALALGKAATAWGLELAVDLGALSIALVCVGTLVFASVFVPGGQAVTAGAQPAGSGA